MSGRTRGGAPHHVDVHVGQRVRAYRRQAGLSLGALARRVGVAFQQLQKYETGANRMSASTLFEVARALKAPVASFFDGLPETAGGRRPDLEVFARVEAVLAIPGGPGLLDAFVAMPAPTRRQLAALAQAIAQMQPASAASETPSDRKVG